MIEFENVENDYESINLNFALKHAVLRNFFKISVNFF